MGKYLKLVVALFLAFFASNHAFAVSDSTKVYNIYTFKINQQIDNSAYKLLKDALQSAKVSNADYCILELNTYGGAVDFADSIRTTILNSEIPIICFINSQAVSAGALISIACDSIYMKSGGTFGAATVVDQSGKVLPDKYQSFMRAMMRATAESHGKKIVIKGNDTIYLWKRDPNIAQSMVSKDSVLSFTLSEAIKNSYCEGEANSVKEVAEKIVALQDADYKIIEHKISTLNKIIYFLLNPYLQGILLMLIIGGIYFEMQSPGIGFALAITIISAILYFAPLYLEGLAQNWELIIFLIGVGLIFAEIFVIPGFGIAGISGIILVIVGLAFAMVDNSTLKEIDGINLKPIIRPFAMVLVSTTAALFLSIYLASKLYPTKAFSYVALKTKLSSGSEGFVGVEKIDIESLVGKTVVVATDMKPQGSIDVDGKRYQAQMMYGYAQKGEKVIIIKSEGGRLYCKKEN